MPCPAVCLARACGKALFIDGRSKNSARTPPSGINPRLRLPGASPPFLWGRWSIERHIHRKSGRLQLVRQLRQKIERRKPPSAEMIRKIELMKWRASEHDNALQGDAKRARNGAQ